MTLAWLLQAFVVGVRKVGFASFFTNTPTLVRLFAGWRSASEIRLGGIEPFLSVLASAKGFG